MKLVSGLLGGVTKAGDDGELGSIGGMTGSGELGEAGGMDGTGELGTTGGIVSSRGLCSGKPTGSEIGSVVGLATGVLSKTCRGEGFGLGPGNVGVSGLNFLKNCLFLSVTLPLPSILTLYLLKPRSSTIRPDLSHFFEIFPAPY